MKRDIEHKNENILYLHTFRYSQRWRPLIPQNIQTDGSIGIDVRVIDLRPKADFGWLEGVIGWERDCKEENSARIR
jgi:hypothetical protein